jgi:hypothetical protein
MSVFDQTGQCTDDATEAWWDGERGRMSGTLALGDEATETMQEAQDRVTR